MKSKSYYSKAAIFFWGLVSLLGDIGCVLGRKTAILCVLSTVIQFTATNMDFSPVRVIFLPQFYMSMYVMVAIVGLKVIGWFYEWLNGQRLNKVGDKSD